MNERDILIQTWLDAKAVASEATAKEAELRKAVIASFFGEQLPEKGTVNQELGNGYALKFAFGLTYKVDPDKVEKALTELENHSDEGKFIASRLIKFKPELSVSEYGKLDDKARKIIDKALTSKPSSTQITFVEPKAK